jgi:hypothetical protein
MPKLRVMELWFAGTDLPYDQGHGCIFRYNRANDAGRPQLTMVSSWTISQKQFARVARVWRALHASKANPPPMDVVFESMPGKRYQGSAEVISRLHLRRNVVDETTYRQLVWEQMLLRRDEASRSGGRPPRQADWEITTGDVLWLEGKN